jgi:serine/threonine-protein kinase
MGVVYLASDVMLGRKVAIKMLLPDQPYGAEQLAAFKREASALAAVRDEHVVHVYAFGEHRGMPYFVMEFVRGTDLEALIAQHARHQSVVPLHRALTILAQVARGLGAVHRAGVLHRDVKPANIIIEEGSGRPVLIDFGLVNLLGNRGNDTHAEGTPDYMAPEVWQPSLGPISTASDVYSLGCTAYELFTGRPPFFEAEGVAAIMSAHLVQSAPVVSARRPELFAFDPVFVQTLSKSPAERYPDPLTFAAALRDVAPPSAQPELPVWSNPFVAPVVAAAPPQAPPAADQPVHILVIDDDPIFRKVITRAAQLAFQDALVQVTAAVSGAEALEQAAQTPPDLVLLDYNMPELNGLDTLSRLRALPSGAGARVLVVSGSVRSLERWPFAVLGVQDFYDKTGGLPPLVDLIGKVADQLGLRGPRDAGDRPTVI